MGDFLDAMVACALGIFIAAPWLLGVAYILGARP
jgi:hypothetical protein